MHVHLVLDVVVEADRALSIMRLSYVHKLLNDTNRLLCTLCALTATAHSIHRGALR